MLVALLWTAAYAAVVALSELSLMLVRLPFPLSLLLLWIVETPLIYYIALPICRVLRIFDYLSNCTLLYGSKRSGKLGVHLGMNHDIIFRLMPARRKGEKLIQTLQRDINCGMVELCARIDRGEIRADAVITIGSYFLSARKMERLGMKRKGRSLNTAMNFLFAYPSIILDQILLNRRVVWFNPFKVDLYTISAAEFATNRSYFERRI